MKKCYCKILFNCLPIVLYFHEHKSAIGIDEKCHEDRNIDCEKKGKNQ